MAILSQLKRQLSIYFTETKVLISRPQHTLTFISENV